MILVTILELIVHTLILNVFGNLQLNKIVVMPINTKVSHNSKVLESIVMAHDY